MCLFMTVYFPVPVNCVQYLMTFENVHVSFYNEAFHQLVLCCRFFFFKSHLAPNCKNFPRKMPFYNIKLKLL